MKMSRPALPIVIAFVLAASAASRGQQPSVPEAQPDDPVKLLVGRLDLERYKATIKGLTQFGDRREGTDRNRAAVDWIEMQLKSYGCATERLVRTSCTRHRRPSRVAAVLRRTR